MSEGDDIAADLARIADALERLSPPTPVAPDWLSAPAYVWDGDTAIALETVEAPALDQLRGIDRQKSRFVNNLERLASGHAAHDALLWGARGMGKSALLRAGVLHVQQKHHGALALVQVAPDAMHALPRLFRELSSIRRQFVIFVDDLGFAEDDFVGPRQLRSWLEGGVEARPSNSRLVVTSNRRAILARNAEEQSSGRDSGALNERDAVDDKLALADRFGLVLGFHPCDKPTYLEIVAAHAKPLGLAFDEDEAMEFAAQRGQRSGRTAHHFVVTLAGRAGKQA